MSKLALKYQSTKHKRLSKCVLVLIKPDIPDYIAIVNIELLSVNNCFCPLCSQIIHDHETRKSVNPLIKTIFCTV